MKNIPLLVGTIIGSVLLVIALSVGLSSRSPEDVSEVIVDTQTVSEGGRHTKGAESSGISIVEFSDLQCPACKAALPVVNQLIAQHGDDVTFVYRHLPLDSIHPNARHAAWASEVASESDKFWEMHDLLFEKQEEWSQIASEDALIAQFGEYASTLDLDKDAFIERIKSPEIADLVQADVTAGNAAGVTGTPTFFVNGKKTAAQQLLNTVQSLTASQQ